MRKTVEIEKRTIHIRDLCRLWRDPPDEQSKDERYTNQHGQGATQSRVVVDPASVPVALEKWSSPKIQGFYKIYVQPYFSAIPKSQHDVIIKLLDLLGNQDIAEKTASIDPNDPDIEQRYKNMVGISLLDHTLSVARKACEYQKQKTDAHIMMGSVLIAALAHDIGQLADIRGRYGAGLDNHVFGSGQWVKRELESIQFLDRISEAVCYHHASDKELEKRCNEDNTILQILRQADQAVREAELKKAGSAASNTHKKAEKLPIQPQVSETAQKIQPVTKNTPSAGNQSQALENNQTTDENQARPDNDTEEKIGLYINETDADKEEEFFNWFDEFVLLDAIQQNVTSKGLDCFYFDGHVYVTPKALFRIINEKRIEKSLPPFDDIKDARDYVSVKISRIKNVQCRLYFKRKPEGRKPYKGYYYVVDVGHFRKDLATMDTEPATDLQGHIIDKSKILNEILTDDNNR